MRREPLLAAAACVLGAFLVLVGAGRAWVLVDVAGSALLPARQVPVTGADLAPGLGALGLVGLAGVPALAASRGRGRTAVGVVLLAVGLGVLAVVLRLELSPLRLGGLALASDPVRQAGGAQGGSFTLTPWPVLTAVGAVVLAVAGLLVAVRGRRWSTLGRRYEAPVAGAAAAPAPAPAPAGDAPVVERELWEALDRGEDPTGQQDRSDPPSSGSSARD